MAGEPPVNSHEPRRHGDKKSDVCRRGARSSMNPARKKREKAGRKGPRCEITTHPHASCTACGGEAAGRAVGVGTGAWNWWGGSLEGATAAAVAATTHRASLDGTPPKPLPWQRLPTAVTRHTNTEPPPHAREPRRAGEPPSPASPCGRRHVTTAAAVPGCQAPPSAATEGAGTRRRRRSQVAKADMLKDWRRSPAASRQHSHPTGGAPAAGGRAGGRATPGEAHLR